jgi:prephenate dehydratase
MIIGDQFIEGAATHASRPVPLAAGSRQPTAADPWIELDPLGRCPTRAVGTLGPAGTSSERAAEFLWRRLAGAGPEPEVVLYDSYEDAGEALRADEVSHVVVANAYSAVNEFYMDALIALAAVFYLETPPYGIARDVDRRVPERPTVASHPAPVSLVGQLLPAPYLPGEISLVLSTSAAARAVREREADLALTTEPAADRYGLEFISRTRTIHMVWSVFVAEPVQA